MHEHRLAEWPHAVENPIYFMYREGKPTELSDDYVTWYMQCSIFFSDFYKPASEQSLGYGLRAGWLSVFCRTQKILDLRVLKLRVKVRYCNWSYFYFTSFKHIICVIQTCDNIRLLPAIDGNPLNSNESGLRVNVLLN